MLEEVVGMGGTAVNVRLPTSVRVRGVQQRLMKLERGSPSFRVSYK